MTEDLTISFTGITSRKVSVSSLTHGCSPIKTRIKKKELLGLFSAQTNHTRCKKTQTTNSDCVTIHSQVFNYAFDDLRIFGTQLQAFENKHFPK